MPPANANKQDPNKHVNGLVERQHADVLYTEITGANFTANDNVIEFEAQPGSEILRGWILVLEPFDAGGADTLKFGDLDDEDRYGAAINLKAAAQTNLVPDHHVFGMNAQTNVLRLERTSAGAEPTPAGRLRLCIEFVKFGKWYHTQG